MSMNRTTPVRSAFTLIEMMVVVAIIGLLVAALLPAFNTVRTRARRTQAVAQFQALAAGLNMFRAEQSLGGSLPPSASDNTQGADGFQLIANPRKSRIDDNNNGNDPVRIAGAHLLVHAMIGADLLGTAGFRDLDRDGLWWNDTHDTPGAASTVGGAYALDTEGREEHTRFGGAGFVDDTMREQVTSLRKLEERGAILNLSDAAADIARDELLFVDPWDMPILYYKANSYNLRMTTDSNTSGIYRQEDNGIITGTEAGIIDREGLDFGPGRENGRYHAIAVAQSPDPTTGRADPVEDVLTDPVYDDSFARFILDPSIKARPTPVRKDSYLLISAGPDSRYGTEDDITNWQRQVD